MRSSKIWGVLIGTVVCILLLNQLLTFILEPAQSSSSDTMWYGYQNRETMDTIFVGSSLVSRSLDPDRYDRIMGTKSYNMGTNAQMFAQSYTAIETAWREHGVKTVILGIGYFEFQSRQGIGNEVAFYRARNHYSTIGERLRNDARYVLSADNFDSSVSVNYFFPWVYDHVTVTAADIAKNVREKRSSAEKKEMGKPGNGFSNADTTQLDFNTLSYSDTSSAQSQKEVQPAYDELAKICDFCQQRGIVLFVINMPLPEYYVVAFPDQYFERAEKIRQTCAAHGTAYYDYNVSRPELFERKDGYYMDFEHMNQEGAETFTDSVARLVKAVQNGADVSSWFYAKEKYLHSVDRIVCTNFTWSREAEGGFSVQAYAYCGSDVEPEFQFSVQSADETDWNVVQEFSGNSIFQMSAKDAETWKNSSGHICVRVEAKDGRMDEKLKMQGGKTVITDSCTIRCYEEELY